MRILRSDKHVVQGFASMNALVRESRWPSSERDKLRVQVIQLNLDLLEYLELDDAIKQEHVSRMENLLPSLLYCFQGGNNKLYVVEVTELSRSYIKNGWTM